jgi:hypothetical protein
MSDTVLKRKINQDEDNKVIENESNKKQKFDVDNFVSQLAKYSAIASHSDEINPLKEELFKQARAGKYIYTIQEYRICSIKHILHHVFDGVEIQYTEEVAKFQWISSSIGFGKELKDITDNAWKDISIIKYRKDQIKDKIIAFLDKNSTDILKQSQKRETSYENEIDFTFDEGIKFNRYKDVCKDIFDFNKNLSFFFKNYETGTVIMCVSWNKLS